MFRDPIAQVQFTNPKSGKVWNWTAPEFPFLTGVTLAYEFERQAQLQLTFEAPYQDAIDRLLVVGSPFTIGTQVDARIGYASRAEPWWTGWFSGFLLEGGDQLTLDPNGMSGQVNVQVVSKEGRYALKQAMVEDYLRGSPVEMLKACGDLLGFDPAQIHLSQATLQSEFGGIIPDEKIAAWRPDTYARMGAWDVIKDLCKLLNITYWIGPDQNGQQALQFASELELTTGSVFKQKPPANAGKDAIATLAMRGVVDLTKSQFPCITWAPEGAAWATWLAGNDNQAGKGVNLAYVDRDTQNIVEVPSIPANRQVATVGSMAPGPQDLAGTDPDAFPASGDAKLPNGGQPVQVSAPMPAGPAGQQRAQLDADRRVAAGNPSQVGVITTLGLPWLIPGIRVNLVGCGAVYDGLYMVQKATHTWSGGNYETSLNVWRVGAVDRVGEKIQSPVGEMTA